MIRCGTRRYSASELLDFSTRQIVMTRVYAPRRWILGMISHFWYVLTLLYAVIVIFAAMISGDSWVQLALLTVVIVLIAVMKGAIRTAAINELLPEWRSQLQQWSWVWMALAPVVPFLFAWNFLNSLVTKRIRCAGCATN